MKMASFQPLPLFVAALLATFGPLAAPLHGRQAEARVRLKKFEDPGLFQPGTSLIGFRDIPEGELVDGPMGIFGLRLSLRDGTGPRAWIDRETRCFPPNGAGAICNRDLQESFSARSRNGVKPGNRDYILRATFEFPVNRVGFEMRGIDPGDLNVILRCFYQGNELGSQFYETDEEFHFLGIESSGVFDELHVELTNPSEADFSVDNFAHELNLRDSDGDGWTDFDDLCPLVPDPSQTDSDGDGIGDACDAYPLDAQNDFDGDGFGEEADNCPLFFNPDQRDGDLDGIGDACDPFPFGSDADGDGVGDLEDNCPTTFNPEQADCDLDGIGDVCDPSLINPQSVDFVLRPGECRTIEKTICLPPAPPVVDVVILFDSTGSMGGEIRKLRQNVVAFVTGVRQALPLSDIRFALATFRDYPNVYEGCGYSARYARPIDQPFRVNAPIQSSDAQVLTAINQLKAEGGQDQFESYSRALWEVTQPDSGIGFREGSARFVLLVGDSAPHDCNLGMFLGDCLGTYSSGRDPGRDGISHTEDDIDFQRDALAGLIATNTRLLMIYTGPIAFCTWDLWCQGTGGVAIHASADGELPQGTNLVGRLVNLIRDPVIDLVRYTAENTCGLELSFDPPVIEGPIDVSLGARVTFRETICVPLDAPSLTSLDCQVRIFSDEVLLGVQNVHVETGCTQHVLDFETEDDGVTPVANGQALSSPPEFGRLVMLSSTGSNLGLATFDSTPGGPNDPSVNTDMLIGHGNVLVLQSDDYPAQRIPGFFDTPTDDADGGEMVFSFMTPVDPRSVLLADINPPPNLGASLMLIDEADRTRTYAIPPGWTGRYGDAGPKLLDLTTLSPQMGDRSLLATAAQDPGFQQTRVTRIVVHMTGFGAVDELTFCH